MEIVHELPGRLRIRCPRLLFRGSDPLYIQAIVENISGVERVRINRHAASVIVNYDTAEATRTAVLAGLRTLPPESFRYYFDKRGKAADLLDLVALGGMVFVLRLLPPSLQGAISLLIGLPTLLEGIDTLLNPGIKVEVLDAGAVGFSLLRRDYFTANMIVFLLSVGEYLEQYSEDQTTGLLKALLRPQVDEVWLEKDGVEVSVPLEQVRPHDIIVCGAGEMIPVDGVVAHGDALLNQSSLTGESLPVHKQGGDEVLSGAVVEEGKVAIRVVNVGNDTGMARISRFLENSLRSGSQSQKQSDQLADSLVPVTFALGTGIFLATRDISRSAAVLTVDYSCSIKLATPIAVKTAMYAAAHQGVLIKGARAFDQLALVDTLVFDKTGTLTHGELQVTDVKPVRGMGKDDLLALTAGAEEHYAHPVAKAVVRAAHERGLELPPISQVDFIVAHGVSAYVDGKQVLVGSRHFIEEDEGVDCSIADRHINSFYEQGKSLLYVARNGRLEGLIAMRDRVRVEAAVVLERLKHNGIRKIVVLTGDHEKTALALKKELPGIDQVYWELKPENKADIIQALKAQGHYTAFVGDGVNDAPALVTADVGISLPSGADLAKEAAQAILLREDLSLLADAIEISRKTRETIRNSFYATIGFNSLFLLLALTGRIRPLTSALLHNLNTVGILGYSAARGLNSGNKETGSRIQEGKRR
jgi:Cu2+-exporting ATPase